MQEFDIAGKEHDELLEIIVGFLKRHSLEVPGLEWVVTVCGPGGFTSTRIVSLIVNTWRSLYHLPTQSLTLFDVFEKAGWKYPMCVKANRGEYLLQTSKEGEPYICSLQDVPNGIYAWIGDISDFADRNISIQSHIEYSSLISEFIFMAEDKNIEPYYIKKPNIT